MIIHTKITQKNFYLACPLVFRKTQVKLTEKMRIKLENIFSQPDVKKCREKCQVSSQCIANLITQHSGVSDTKLEKVECMFYGGNCNTPSKNRGVKPRFRKKGGKF